VTPLPLCGVSLADSLQAGSQLCSRSRRSKAAASPPSAQRDAQGAEGALPPRLTYRISPGQPAITAGQEPASPRPPPRVGRAQGHLLPSPPLPPRHHSWGLHWAPGVGPSLAPAPRESPAPLPSAPQGIPLPSGAPAPLSASGDPAPTGASRDPAPLKGPARPGPRAPPVSPQPRAREPAGPRPESPALTRRSPAIGHTHQPNPDSRQTFPPLASSAGRRDPQRRLTNERRGRAVERGWLSARRQGEGGPHLKGPRPSLQPGLCAGSQSGQATHICAAPRVASCMLHRRGVRL